MVVAQPVRELDLVERILAERLGLSAPLAPVVGGGPCVSNVIDGYEGH